MADNIKQMKLDLANSIHSISSSIGDNALLYFHTDGQYENFLNEDIDRMLDVLKKWKDIAKEKDNG